MGYEPFVIFGITLIIIYFMWVALSKEEGFVLSTKRLGGVLVVLMLLVQIIILVSEFGKKQELLKIIIEHNITLPAVYEKEVYDTKLELETIKIKEKLDADGKN